MLLPPSWGARPEVLPALQDLSLSSVSTHLPAAWARGFQQLKQLSLVGMLEGVPLEEAQRFTCHTRGNTTAPAATAAALLGAAAARTAATLSAGGQQPAAATSGQDPHTALQPGRRQLPGEWAAGFPALEVLEIGCMQLDAPLPQEWLAGGFPMLTTL